MSDSPARTALLDAAEALFATHGIGAVSNRRIVEAAGAANHSAISYHFGGRIGLLEALVTRHERQAIASRAEYPGPDSASTYDVLRSRIVPLALLLERLPQPSWRARFLAHARHDTDALPLLEAAARRSAAEIIENPPAIDPTARTIIRARAGLVANMVMGVLAQHEAQREAGTAEGTWLDVAYFLVDAAAGMIDAPITYTGPVPRDAGVPLI